MAVSILFAIMSYFYKYVDIKQLEQYRSEEPQPKPQDETSALILSSQQSEERHTPLSSETEEYKSESEF